MRHVISYGMPNEVQEALDELDLEKVGIAHYFKPTAALYENVPRLLVNSSSSMTSGTMRLTPIWLPSGTVITSISAFSGAPGMTGGTNQWFALYDSSRNLLRQTVDDGATAWGAQTKKTLNLTSQFTTTYTGLHYIGVMIAAATPPVLCAVIAGGNGLLLEAPALAGISTAGLTSTAPNPAAAPSASTVAIYAFVS